MPVPETPSQIKLKTDMASRFEERYMYLIFIFFLFQFNVFYFFIFMDRQKVAVLC